MPISLTGKLKCNTEKERWRTEGGSERRQGETGCYTPTAAKSVTFNVISRWWSRNMVHLYSAITQGALHRLCIYQYVLIETNAMEAIWTFPTCMTCLMYRFRKKSNVCYRAKRSLSKLNFWIEREIKKERHWDKHRDKQTERHRDKERQTQRQ